MTYLINPEARGVDNPSHVWDWGFCHVTGHVFLARPLSTLLRAICQPLPPGCEFWCGRGVLLTRRAISRSSSAASPFSTSCEGWVGACITRFLTAIPRTQEDLAKLLKKTIEFLKEFEKLYVGNDASKISCCRLCVFQLVFIPFHITFNGSIRFGSQATCERAIGDIGHGIRSKKSPFKNIVSYKEDKQSVRLLHLVYPTVSSAPKAENESMSPLFTKVPITQRQRKEDEVIKAHIELIQSYPGVDVDEIMRWGKCSLSNNITLTSRLFELSKRSTSRSSRYFEAHSKQGMQPRNQPIHDTEIEVENVEPIFGEALAFYSTQVAGAKISLVVYHPLMELHNLFGRWYGKWSPSLCVLETSAIVSLVGIWTYNENVHILRKHPGLTLLTLDESGIENPLIDVE